MFIVSVATKYISDNFSLNSQNEFGNYFSDRSYKTSSRTFNLRLLIKVGFSPYKKICGVCLIERPLKMMKNVFFFFFLKAVFVLKLFKFLSRPFGHVAKMA